MIKLTPKEKFLVKKIVENKIITNHMAMTYESMVKKNFKNIQKADREMIKDAVRLNRDKLIYDYNVSEKIVDEVINFQPKYQ